MPTTSLGDRPGLPGDASQSGGESTEVDTRDASVVARWQRGDVTTRGAARELSLTYRAFLDLLTARGIPVESRSPDLDAIATARRTLAQRRP